MQDGLFSVIQFALSDENSNIRSIGLDILLLAIESNVKSVQNFIVASGRGRADGYGEENVEQVIDEMKKIESSRRGWDLLTLVIWSMIYPVTISEIQCATDVSLSSQ